MTKFEKDSCGNQVSDGTDVLGIPIGSTEYRKKRIIGIFRNVVKQWELVKTHVKTPQMRHDLLLYCYRSSFTHVLRTIPPTMFKRFQTFN